MPVDYNDTRFMNAIALTRLPDAGHVADALEMVKIPVVRPTPNEVAIRLRASSMHIDEVYAAQGTASADSMAPESPLPMYRMCLARPSQVSWLVLEAASTSFRLVMR